MEGAGLVLHVDLSEPVPLIWSDRIRIRQVLRNLLSNAVKYTDVGSVEVRAEIRPNPRTPDGEESVALRVSDTGHGISPDKQHLLFREFARLEPAATAGAGLGLAISLSIATALDGTITVESARSRLDLHALAAAAHRSRGGCPPARELTARFRPASEHRTPSIDAA